jgi:hypothetical protein
MTIQAKDHITDGPDDKELDAVSVDDERRQVIVIESKFDPGSLDHQPLQEILAAWLQIQNLPALRASCEGARPEAQIPQADAIGGQRRQVGPAR